MNSFFTQVSSSIRILGWNRDASARATHLKAADGNVPSATIERKSMSTKTSIKRIALVAAAALAIGGFSAVSARAADNLYIGGALGDGVSSFSLANTTLSGVAGPANFVQIGVGSGSTGILTISGGTFGVSSNAEVVVNTAGTQAVATSVSATRTVNVPTPTVGTITVNYYKQVSAGQYAQTPTESVVITVNAAASSGVFSAAKSTIYLASGETSVASATTDAVAVVAASTITTETAAATVVVTLLDSLGARYKDSVTATIISGPGTLFGSNESRTATINPAPVGAPGVETTTATRFASNASSPAYSVTVPGVTADGQELRSMYFGIFANGQAGTSVIQFKNSAGTVLGSKSVTFYSLTPAKVTVKVLKANVLNSTTPTNKVFAVNVYDSGNNEITGTQTISAAVATGSLVGGTVSCATSQDATAAAYLCSAAASSTQAALTTDASETYTFTAGTATTTAAVKFVSGVLTTISVAGPASADPGTKVTYTLTALGANGAALPDGDYAAGAIFTNADPVTNAQLVAIPFGKSETITLANGVATDYTYAPFSGTLSASWTVAGTASTALAATSGIAATSYFTAAGLAKAIAATTVTAEDVAVSANTEATAAANAATDAANQAADAADNATQAAAEALAAVNTLATTVATLIAGIKKQISALNALIVKIKNKVKA